MSSFTRVAFVQDVMAVHETRDTHAAYRALTGSGSDNGTLGPVEQEFISRADRFYLVTISESGWPYVQHFRGSVGFLRPMGEQMLSFVTFDVNNQMLSTDSSRSDDRVSLFIMDYAHRRRLKLWGKAKTIEPWEDSSQITRLASPYQRNHSECSIQIRIEAFDWNYAPGDRMPGKRCEMYPTRDVRRDRG